MEERDSDIEILDVENYKGQKDQIYSHQSLVMSALKRCNEAGSKEMRSGYMNEKLDRMGNKVRNWIPDSRKEFIESVKSAEMVMTRDFDDKAKEKITAIKKKIREEYVRLIKEEEKEWEHCKFQERKSRWFNGVYQMKNSMNMKLSSYQEYIEIELEGYRQICTELNNLTLRLNDYQQEEYEA